MTRRVCIVGYSPHRDQHPREGWEVAAFNESWRWCQPDRLYELHDPATISDDPDHHDWLRTTDVPVFAFHPQPDWPTAKPLDGQALINEFCPVGPYMTNTVSWVVAHLLSEGMGDGDELALYGVDMAAWKELNHERPSVEYMLGVAHGRGVHITTPDECDLLRCATRYGLDGAQTLIEARLWADRQRLVERLQDADPYEAGPVAGALEEVENILRTRYHQGDGTR